MASYGYGLWELYEIHVLCTYNKGVMYRGNFTLHNDTSYTFLRFLEMQLYTFLRFLARIYLGKLFPRAFNPFSMLNRFKQTSHFCFPGF